MIPSPMPPRPRREWFSSAKEYRFALNSWVKLDEARRQSDAWNQAIALVGGGLMLAMLGFGVLATILNQFGWRGLSVAAVSVALFVLVVAIVQRRLLRE